MTISLRAYARHRGINESAVRKAIKFGRITREADGGIEPAKADQQWAQNTHPGYGQKVNDPMSESTGKPSNYSQAKAANEILKAQTAKVQLDKLKGDLIDKKKALAHVFHLAREARDAWLNWPARISAEMAATLEVDESLLYQTLVDAVHDHLTEMSEFKARLD